MTVRRASGIARHLISLWVLAASSGTGCSGSDSAESTPPPPWHPDRGAADIDGTFEYCPTITSYSIVPPRMIVGGDILLSGVAKDVDTQHLSFAWTATSGTLETPLAADTLYRCTVPGKPTITLSVSDGSCADTVSGQLECGP
jgi:hypothetical protein